MFQLQGINKGWSSISDAKVEQKVKTEAPFRSIYKIQPANIMAAT